MTRIVRVDSQSIETRAPASSLGDIAARAFEMLDQGMAADEIVVALVLPPDVVETLLRTWTRLRGLVPLTAEAAQIVCVKLHEFNSPIRSGADLVAVVRRFEEHPPIVCRRCRKVWAEYCESCPPREARRAVKRKARSVTRRGSNPPEPSEERAPGLFSAELEAAILRAASRPPTKSEP